MPALLRIIQKERFDVILEIAIDALGNIGDQRAIRPLERLLSDPSLDAYVRDAVSGALRKLGAKGAQPPKRTGSGTGGKGKPPKRGGSEGDPKVEDLPPERKTPFDKLPDLQLPSWPKDLIARSSQFDIAASSGQFRWEGAGWGERTVMSLGAKSRYRLQVERLKVGYTIDGATTLDFRLYDPTGDDNTSWDLAHALQLNPEVRFYPFTNDLPLLFGQFSGGVSWGLGVAKPPTSFDEKRVTFGSTISAAFAPGYGRVVDAGSQLRVARVERALRLAGVLEKVVAIDKATAAKLAAMWYRYRNTVGSYGQLGYTIDILKKAGLLREAVDPATTYRLIRVLDDPQLMNRPSGYLFKLGYGYTRTLVKDADDDNLGYLFSTASYYKQYGTTRQLSAIMRFYWSHIGEPDTYNLNFESAYDWFLYNRALDPLGSIGMTFSAGINNQPGSVLDNGGIGYQVLAGGHYTRYFSRGSRIIASLQGGMDRRGGLVLVSLEARYGIAAGSYSAVPLQ